MNTPSQSLHRRFGNLRPGLQLLSIEDAALPVTVLRVDVLAQEKKNLPVIEEFVLRFVESGIDAVGDIAGYLGLDAPHVIDAAAAQLSHSTLSRIGDDRLRLTEQGREVVRELAATQPVMQQLPATFDRLTWLAARYQERFLLTKKQAEEFGMTILPASRNAVIGMGDVTPAGLNALLVDDRLQILRIHRVTTRKHRYLPVSLLVYGNVEQQELELALCIDDELSPAHSLSMGEVGVVNRLGFKVGEAEPRPILDPELEALRSTDSESEEANGELPFAEEAPTEEGHISTSQVRSVSVFEHPDLLNQALTSAKARILLISPWIRGAVVNRDFAGRLEGRLRAGVSVTIAHGIGDDDSGSDAGAIDRLAKLAAKYANFDFVRLRNTHAKVLVFDDNWVNTSFNWLSFRGDPKRTYRMEEGTLVAVRARVDKEYSRYLEMVHDQRVR